MMLPKNSVFSPNSHCAGCTPCMLDAHTIKYAGEKIVLHQSAMHSRNDGRLCKVNSSKARR